jgi:hypothetical protein
MTKPKEATKATPAAKPAAAKKAAAAPAAEKSAKPPVTEAPATETKAPKSTPAPEAAQPEAEAPKAEEKPATVGGGLNDLLGMLTGAIPFEPTSFFKDASDKIFAGIEKEAESEEEAGFAEEIIARAMSMASHPVYGIGVCRDEVPTPADDFVSVGLADFLDSVLFAPFGADADEFGGCCVDPFAQDQEPVEDFIVERDETTVSMGHLVELKKLYDHGILTEKEYTDKKQDILRSMYR